MQGIEQARDFSEAKLSEVRSAVAAVVPPEQLVITCGSYARREASSESDLDYYSIFGDDYSIGQDPGWISSLREAVEATVGKLPADQGAFAANIKSDALLRNYGGSRDSNETITRRMLYLLEGEYLSAPESFVKIRRQIIERYVANTPKDHQVAFYLLNDVVRYWRTMAVDYAEKTYGADTPKPWAIRNIKLIFSRKLIYASGIFSIALTADRSLEAKIDVLEKLFSMTPVERIKYVCGESSSERLMQMYSFFLENIAQREVRDELNALSPDHKSTNKRFRELKNEGHYFSRELMGLFQKTFHSSHPIHMAVIF